MLCTGKVVRAAVIKRARMGAIVSVWVALEQPLLERFKQRVEWGKKSVLLEVWRKTGSGRGKSECKGPAGHLSLSCWKSRGLSLWLGFMMGRRWGEWQAGASRHCIWCPGYLRVWRSVCTHGLEALDGGGPPPAGSSRRAGRVWVFPILSQHPGRASARMGWE